MSSIGPQLPAELTKRKRSPDPDDAHSAASPPLKQARRHPEQRPDTANNDEIDLSDSDNSDDGMGPSAPSAPSSASIGAMRPPPTASALPPPPPPQAQPQPQPQPQDSASSSDSEDDYGPSLPSSTTSRQTIGPTLPSSEPTPQRDTWMLAPPPSTSYSERDPTRLRARKFTSKPLSSGAKPSPDSPSIWTETPQQKLQRQKDALLGRTPSSSSSATATNPSTTAQLQQRQQEDRIAASIAATRGTKSLYAEHDERRRRDKRDKNGDDDDDDPSKRAFDREKDMAIGGKIGSRARTELISKSANFGGRFQKGSFL
ncbi:hypothetical protein E4U55_007059 [Claviceps digitariae]|nr:hypothetical protein E4U55_007059 [Claviceps digitariae]